jgi:capsid protein
MSLAASLFSLVGFNRGPEEAVRTASSSTAPQAEYLHSATQLGANQPYDAVEERGRRESPAIRTQSEDRILLPTMRQKLDATAQDLHRNFAVAQWMIRRHLDYVSTFTFHSRSDNDEFDEQLNGLMAVWAQRQECDAAGRHRFDKIVRLAELQAVLRGDVGLMKLANGQTQGIEGDRIRNPLGTPYADPTWIHGVKVDAAGKALNYAIHRRLPYGSYELERQVPAANLILHGYFDRFDQIRGISPIVTALNPLRDTYEACDLALAKSKVEQLFALAFYRNATESGGELTEETETTADGSTTTSSTAPKYQVNFGKGPVLLDLDPGDRAEFLQSSSPSANFQAFTQLVLMIAMKALDLPFGFFDEAHTNFYSSRGAWLIYERACQDKRDALIEVLTELTRWRVKLWVLDGALKLPKGMTVDTVPFEWVPGGMPFWDPSKEMRGNLQAISAGLDNPQRITKESGLGDFYDNCRQIAKAQKFARDLGLTLSFDAGPPEVQVVSTEGNSGK